MSKLNLEKYREEWEKAMQLERPFDIERPLAFSPAAAAQEGNGSIAMFRKFIGTWTPWQYTSWIEEGRSFHDTAYIGDWSSLVKCRVKGPDALKYLSYVGTNDLSNFSIGQIKHLVKTNADGKIAGEGILFRIDDDDFRYTGGGPYWMEYIFKQGKWDAEFTIDSPDIFVFAVQGPQSLAILEKVTGESLRDIAFNRARISHIRGMEVRILRTGITGELGYEIHGSAEDANDVWTIVIEAGQEFGIKRLGARSQLISHIEAGIATIGYEFIPSAALTPGKSRVHAISTRGGSYEISNIRELFRSPFELGWDREVSLDHDFLGHDALAAELKAGGPARRLVGLVWNSDDVIDVFAGLFREGPSAPPMDLPRLTVKHSMEADKVLKNGTLVGCSTSRVYSPYLRKMISLCTIDKYLTDPGSEVTVIWGDPEGPQKEIRATVAKLPFKEDKRRIDVRKL